MMLSLDPHASKSLAQPPLIKQALVSIIMLINSTSFHADDGKDAIANTKDTDVTAAAVAAAPHAIMTARAGVGVRGQARCHFAGVSCIGLFNSYQYSSCSLEKVAVRGANPVSM